MIPVILVASSEKQVKEFILGYASDYQVDPARIIELYPATKEYGINQIKEIRRETAYFSTQPVLYVLHDFDHASYEAQNAFLKILEEHAKEIGFILATPNVHALLPTIASRSKVVSLAPVKMSEPSKKLSSLMEEFLEKPNLSVLDASALDVKKYDDPNALFDELIAIFRGKLETFPHAPLALTEILTARSLVEHSNIAPQHGIDHVFLQLKKMIAGES